MGSIKQNCVNKNNHKTLVISGCSTGIGKAAAELLSARGYHIVAGVRDLSVKDSLRLSDNDVVWPLDLSCSESVQAFAKRVIEEYGDTLFALFNNAAYGQPGAVEDLSRDALRKQFEPNLFGTHELTALLLPTLLEKSDARIVQNSSILGFIGMPMRGAYVASKFALEGLSKTMRMELSDTGVKVSLIEPGPILSAFRANALIALEENIDFDKSRHGWRYVAAMARLSKKGATSKSTLPPEAVVDKLIHALESPTPKKHYYVTTPTYVMAVLTRILPSRWVDKILLKYAKGE